MSRLKRTSAGSYSPSRASHLLRRQPVPKQAVAPARQGSEPPIRDINVQILQHPKVLRNERFLRQTVSRTPGEALTCFCLQFTHLSRGSLGFPLKIQSKDLFPDSNLRGVAMV